MAKKARVGRAVLAFAAETDLDEIWTFIASDNIDAADRVRDELEEAVRKLGDRPAMGHVRKDLSNEPLRFWPVRSYLIVYRPDARPVEIVRILHAARDIKTILDEDE